VQPVLGDQAAEIQLVDRVLCDNKRDFVPCVELEARKLRWNAAEIDRIVRDKLATRTPAWLAQVEAHRARELEQMRACFVSQEYNDARRSFVHKSAAQGTPSHLSYPLPPVSARMSLLLQAQMEAARATTGSAAARASTPHAVTEDALALRQFVATKMPRAV
jgi:hypothetical protein